MRPHLGRLKPKETFAGLVRQSWIDGRDNYRLTDRNRSVGLLDDLLYLLHVEAPQRGGAHVPER